MRSQISEMLLRSVHERFSECVNIQTDATRTTIASISPIYDDFGPVVLQDDDDEVTVFVGNFTHAHFGCYEENLTTSEKAESIATDVVDFLEKLFSDELECYGSHISGGGVRERRYKRNAILSRLFPAKKTYLWSGPSDDA